MELNPSPRTGKIRTILHQPQLTYLEKISPLHTVSGKPIGRASSLIDSKKGPKAQTIGMQKSSKSIKQVQTLHTYSRINKSPMPRSSIMNFVNESKAQEIRTLKSELLALKSSLATVVSESSKLKAEYSHNLASVTNENTGIRSEYIKLIEYIIKNREIPLEVKQEIKSMKKIKALEEDSEVIRLMGMVNSVSPADNPFRMSESYTSNELTARFQSLTEGQMRDLLTPLSEGIILEDFNAGSEDMLSLKAGDRIKVLKKINDYWWLGSTELSIGKFPSKLILID